MAASATRVEALPGLSTVQALIRFFLCALKSAGIINKKSFQMVL